MRFCRLSFGVRGYDLPTQDAEQWRLTRALGLARTRFLAPLGAADSGVYKATDTRRNRIVALKVLPPEFSEHPEMKDRLERDSRTISSLNHPNICALVDVGHHDPATDFIVTEYVEGETLASGCEGAAGGSGGTEDWPSR